MSNHKEQLEALADIRSMMDRSTRFLSLSGLSGVGAGVIALIGAFVAFVYLEGDFWTGAIRYEFSATNVKWGMTANTFMIVDAILVLILALAVGFFFSLRKARRKGYKIWDRAGQRLAMSLLIPMTTGGLVCLILLYQYGFVGLIAPLTLIFYGLTLVNASKYTLNELMPLGLCEIVLGLISLVYIGYGLLFWSIGFGLMHIIYGFVMYKKYD